jgi:uncharacterized membrane protein YcaP (DUF421 family)
MSLSVLVNVMAFRSPWFQELTEGRPELLIQSGRVNGRVMRSERITRRELEAALRRHGLASAAGVAKAYVETNGDITVLKAGGSSPRA